MRRPLLPAALLAFALVGCASLPQGQSKPAPGDPLERINRSMWVFDNALDHAVLRPVASGYVRHTPAPVRHRVRDFLTNLTYPDTIINDFLQGKLHDFGNDFARFVVNSTAGIGGLFDPASHLNLDRHDADVGQTLGIWGLPPGPYLVLPFLGPSDLRDAFGSGADEYLTPRPYLPNAYARWGLYLLDKVDERSQLLDEDKLIDSAFDSYAFVRNAYRQHRRFKVHGSQTETPEQLFPGLNTSGDSGSASGSDGSGPGDSEQVEPGGHGAPPGSQHEAPNAGAP